MEVHSLIRVDIVSSSVSINVSAELDCIPNSLSCNFNGGVPRKVKSEEASVGDWQASVCMILHCHDLMAVLCGGRKASSSPNELEVKTAFLWSEALKNLPEESYEVVVLLAAIVVS